MGRTLENKKEIVADLKNTLSESSMALVINYRGLTVGEMTNLRRRLLDTGAVCKVTKNTLMGKAIEGDDIWSALSPLLKDSAAFILVKEDVSGAVKAYQEFQKASKKSEILGGVMEGRLLTEKDIKVIADLPSKEQLIAQIAGSVSSIIANVAIAVNEIPTGVARAVQAVADQKAA
jgi:large subunit ribosomal protein L10